jgi:hypothetical protein
MWIENLSDDGTLSRRSVPIQDGVPRPEHDTGVFHVSEGFFDIFDASGRCADIRVKNNWHDPDG